MLMTRLLIIISLLCSLCCYSQDSINASGKITKVGWKWKINGHKLTATELEREVYISPNAIPHYKKYKRKRTLGYVFGTAAAVSGLIYGLSASRFENHQSVWKPLTVISTSSATIYFFLSSNSSLKKAVKIRNLEY